ncbi:MAG: c-type cytochrome [Candidatus Binatia bacterium]
MRRTLGVIAALLMLSGTAWAADGAAIYGKKCKTCHSIAGTGGPMAKLGGPLDGVGAKRDEAWLRAYLKDPKSKIPNAKMPKLSLPSEEVDTLVTYLLTLTKPAPGK